MSTFISIIVTIFGNITMTFVLNYTVINLMVATRELSDLCTKITVAVVNKITVSTNHICTVAPLIVRNPVNL